MVFLFSFYNGIMLYKLYLYILFSTCIVLSRYNKYEKMILVNIWDSDILILLIIKWLHPFIYKMNISVSMNRDREKMFKNILCANNKSFGDVNLIPICFWMRANVFKMQTLSMFWSPFWRESNWEDRCIDERTCNNFFQVDNV